MPVPNAPYFVNGVTNPGGQVTTIHNDSPTDIFINLRSTLLSWGYILFQKNNGSGYDSIVYRMTGYFDLRIGNPKSALIIPIVTY